MERTFNIKAINKKKNDCFDTYVKMATIFTIRLLIFLAAINKIVVHQIDLNTIF